MSAKSTRKRRQRKSTVDRPPKPYPDFPLCAANNGHWQKKIKGKIVYFGRWGRVVNGSMTRIQEDGCWQAASELYEQQREALYAGRKPRAKIEGLTVGELRERHRTAKSRALDAGEIAARTYAEYRQTADRLVAMFGEDRPVDDLDAEDFELLRADIAKAWGPIRLANEIQRVRSMFKYAKDAKLIKDEVTFGPGFKKPSARVLRKHRAAKGCRMFTAAEIHSLLGVASPQIKAMILLGVNCGFGNHDVATLPQSALDLANGWIRFPRPKTCIDRRCPLWPETVEALNAAIAERPTPKDKADANLVFVTKYGHRWVRTHGEKKTPIDSVLLEFGKLLKPRNARNAEHYKPRQNPKRAGCDWKPSKEKAWGNVHREGLGFYALRHTFRTVADPTKDFPAIRLIMGHVDGSIDDFYRESVDDSRLVVVTQHVRQWLYGEQTLPDKDNGTDGESEQPPQILSAQQHGSKRPRAAEAQGDFRLRIVG